MKADFYDKNFRKKDSNHTCLPVKGSDTVIKKKKMIIIVHKCF